MGAVLILDHDRLFVWNNDDAVSVEAALQRHTLWRAWNVRDTTAQDNYFVEFDELLNNPEIQAVYAIDDDGTIYERNEDTGQLGELDPEEMEELLLALHRKELVLFSRANGVPLRTLNEVVEDAILYLGKHQYVEDTFTSDQVISWRNNHSSGEQIKQELQIDFCNNFPLHEWFDAGDNLKYDPPEDEFVVEEELAWNSENYAVRKPELRAKDILEAHTLPRLGNLLERVAEEQTEDDVLHLIRLSLGRSHGEWNEVLPRFGGEEPTPGKPYSESMYWSWDEDEVLVGDSFSDLRRVSRDAFEDDQNEEDLWLVEEGQATSLDEDTPLLLVEKLGELWWLVEAHGPKRALKEASILAARGQEAGREEAARLLGAWHGSAIERAKKHLKAHLEEGES